MEDEFAPAITPREILYHLPELVSGREPILENPVARRLMLANPLCRDAVLAVSSIALAYSGQRTAVALDRSASEKSFKRVTTQLPKLRGIEIANLLFEIGTVGIEERARSRGWQLDRTKPVATDPSEIRRKLNSRVAPLFDERSTEVKNLLRTTATHAATFLETALGYVPGNPTILFALQVSKFYETGTASISTLHDISRATTSCDVRAAALGLCGRVLLDQDNHGEALDHYHAARNAHDSYATHALDGALASMLAHDVRSFREFFGSLTRFATPPNAQMLQRQFLGDASKWLLVSRSRPSNVREIMRSVSMNDPILGDLMETE